MTAPLNPIDGPAYRASLVERGVLVPTERARLLLPPWLQAQVDEAPCLSLAADERKSFERMARSRDGSW